jgi:hypothetical protein
MAKWTKAEEEKLIVAYKNNMNVNDIAIKLNRTSRAIKNKAWRLGITRPTSYTDADIQYIKDNYKSYNLREIAKHLGREDNYHNICRKAKELGLERTGKKQEVTKTYRDENGVWHPVGWERRTPEEKAEKASKSMKEWHRHNEHPRGMAGKTHSAKYRGEISKRVKKYWQEVTPEELEERRIKMVMTKIKNDTLNPNKNRNNPYSRARGGKRKDLNDIYFRSSWEANMARFYNFMKIKWEFEPKTFYFEDIKRGCVSYTPDFYLPEEDKWVEVKGWMDSKSKTKIKRFKKYFPEEFEKLEIVGASEYKEVKQWSRLIENWED